MRRELVLEVLRSLATPEGYVFDGRDERRASKAHIARCAGLSVRMTDATMFELLRRGDVELVEAGGGGQSNVYRVELVEDLAESLERKRRAAWQPHIAELLDGHEVRPSTLRRVYALLLAHRWTDKAKKEQTPYAFPGVDHIAEQLELSDRTVQHALDVLDRVGLAKRYELATGELFPTGRRARGGEVMRIVKVVPRPRRSAEQTQAASTAATSPQTPAMSSEEYRSHFAEGTAATSPEVKIHEDQDPEETPDRAREPADEAREVIAAYCAKVFPESLPGEFSTSRVVQIVVALLRDGWTADELVRVAVKGVTSDGWRSAAEHPSRRFPSTIFGNREQLAVWRPKWRRAPVIAPREEQPRDADAGRAPLPSEREKQIRTMATRSVPRPNLDLRSERAAGAR